MLNLLAGSNSATLLVKAVVSASLAKEPAWALSNDKHCIHTVSDCSLSVVMMLVVIGHLLLISVMSASMLLKISVLLNLSGGMLDGTHKWALVLPKDLTHVNVSSRVVSLGNLLQIT